MNDRELLELAAKAAGIEVRWTDSDIYRGSFLRKVVPAPQSPCSEWLYWRPLHDDGDALRLAMKLGICIQFIPECDTACAYQERSTTGEPFNVHVAALGDIETRRVITQAAAEIGKSMEGE